MKFLFEYLKSRRRFIIAQLLFIIIFAVSFFLYHIELKAILYPALLCVLFGVLFIAVDIMRVRRRHKRLCQIKKLTASMIDDLPPKGGIEDADWQEIISALRDEVMALDTAKNKSYRDMVEYYTVWVHQIKTPIAAMKLTLQNEDSALARRLISELFKIEQYVEMVLAFLRLDSNESDYVFKEYDLEPIIRRSIKKFASEFILRKIQLDCKKIKIRTVTDEKWLAFVVEQVISNALKYTREGGKITVFQSGENRICIEDNGIGIAPEDLPRIFEKGYTGYNGRSERQASGLGLYLCKRICKGIGADIYAESTLGQGTRIYIELSHYNFLTKL